MNKVGYIVEYVLGFWNLVTYPNTNDTGSFKYGIENVNIHFPGKTMVPQMMARLRRPSKWLKLLSFNSWIKFYYILGHSNLQR